MSTYVTESKLQSEAIILRSDFLSRLEVGESAVTVATTITVHSGVDPTPTTMISGSPSVTNNLASQRIIGGLPGVVYEVSFAVRTNNNAVYINQLLLAVLTSPNLNPA